MTAQQAPSPSPTAERLPLVVKEVGLRIVGQDLMIERLLIGLLTGGHVLLEGRPGARQDARGPLARPRSSPPPSPASSSRPTCCRPT